MMEYEKEKNKKLKKIQEILKSHDIEMSFFGCGCCSSPDFTFKYKGETIIEGEESMSFDTDNNYEHDD